MLRPPTAPLTTVALLPRSGCSWSPQPQGQVSVQFITVESPASQTVIFAGVVPASRPVVPPVPRVPPVAVVPPAALPPLPLSIELPSRSAPSEGLASLVVAPAVPPEAVNPPPPG